MPRPHTDTRSKTRKLIEAIIDMGFIGKSFVVSGITITDRSTYDSGGPSRERKYIVCTDIEENKLDFSLLQENQKFISMVRAKYEIYYSKNEEIKQKEKDAQKEKEAKELEIKQELITNALKDPEES